MKLRNNLHSIVIILLVLFIFSCEKEQEKEKEPLPDLDYIKRSLNDAHIIPLPLTVESHNSSFVLSPNTVFSFGSQDSTLIEIAKKFEEKLNENNIQINRYDEESNLTATVIHFKNNKSSDSQSLEAYSISIKNDSIIISSNTNVGAFYGIQTLRQLLPEKSVDTLTDYKIWPIPTGKINDSPTFEYRGTMLDVSRHFFTVEEVKQYIDILAYYKINYLHLHLSDDQGWRIEIKSWPKLTEVGGLSEVGGGEGGFYTQEDYKEIVDYAAKHFITIVPEIDMPGHTNAASVSYPFLNGTGKKVEPYTGMRVGFSTFDTRKDSVYIFIDDVIREISEMTPGPYFHIGGDESHATQKNDYVYFVNKVEKIVQKYGKKMIGWDEVATADIDSSSIAQFWRSDENALSAADKNMKVIISPGKKAYLDMKYDENSQYGLTWAGMIPVDTAYIWSPKKYVKELPQENILGIEAPLWSETIGNLKELHYLAFPRVIGYAELAWTPDSLRNWENYKTRLKGHQRYLEMNNVDFYKSPVIDWDK